MTESLDRRRVAAARLWAATKFPYMASALFAAQVIESPGIGAVAVDERWRLYVDPEVISAWSVEDLAGMLVHHSGHLLRDHAGRARDAGVTKRSADDWLIAADAEVNDDLEGFGLTVPGRQVMPQDFGCKEGRFAEEYFAHLEDEDHDHGGGDCGSGADSAPRPWDLPGGGDEGVDQGAARLIRCQVASECLRADGKNPGSVPLGLRRWAEQILRPKVDWRRALAAEIRNGIASETGRVDYSYSRPSRRQSISPQIVLPSLRRPVPDVVVVCDTSGSMSDRMLGQVLAEVDGLLRGVGLAKGRLRVLAVDTAVHAVQRISAARDVVLHGGGGTAMGEGIAAAQALRPRPSVVVVLTDGLTPWPAEPPKGMKVVVGMIAEEGRWSDRRQPPAWAKTVYIDDREVA